MRKRYPEYSIWESKCLLHISRESHFSSILFICIYIYVLAVYRFSRSGLVIMGLIFSLGSVKAHFPLIILNNPPSLLLRLLQSALHLQSPGTSLYLISLSCKHINSKVKRSTNQKNCIQRSCGISNKWLAQDKNPGFPLLWQQRCIHKQVTCLIYL